VTPEHLTELYRRLGAVLELIPPPDQLPPGREGKELWTLRNQIERLLTKVRGWQERRRRGGHGGWPGGGDPTRST
jgi:hypothetical protein